MAVCVSHRRLRLGVAVDIAVGRRGRPLLARFARGALGGVVADLRKSHV